MIEYSFECASYGAHSNINRRINGGRKTDMSWFSPDKERDRFYLLPGMGGSAMRRKRNTMLLWGTLAGLLVSLTVAAMLYWLNSRGLGGP